MTPYRICSVLIGSIVGTAFCISAAAQPPQSDRATRAQFCVNTTTESVHLYRLHNATQQNEANEIYTALRQIMPPEAKSFFIPSQMAIELCAPPEQAALAQRMISELDQPKKNYRLTYTVSELEGTTRVSTHHYSMVVTSGQRATLKQGSRVPVATGPAQQGSHGVDISYVDIGMNFDATIVTTSDGIRLDTTVEQSSVAEEKNGALPQDPVIRQATFKGTSFLAPGKALKVGTFDIPDSNRHLDIEVMMEPLP
jgi:type II secretory pathway component GspD/PulD (secretin)